MRTTIDLDRTLLEEARRLSGMKTYKATVEYCLRQLIEIHQREQDSQQNAKAARQAAEKRR